MTAYEYLEKLNETTPEPILVETDKLPFDDGLFLGVWHSIGVYCDKYIFQHPEGGLRGWAFVCFKVKDKKLISIDVIKTEAHTLTSEEIKEQVINSMVDEISKAIDEEILKDIQNKGLF